MHVCEILDVGMELWNVPADSVQHAQVDVERGVDMNYPFALVSKVAMRLILMFEVRLGRGAGVSQTKVTGLEEVIGKGIPKEVYHHSQSVLFF